VILPSRYRQAVVTVGIMVTVLVSSSCRHGKSFFSSDYEKSTHEEQVFEPSDNPRILLGPRSHILIRSTPESVDVGVLAGEALFESRRTPSRPVTVTGPYATIEAVDTSFAVRVRGDSTTVSVLDGSVLLCASETNNPSLPSSSVPAQPPLSQTRLNSGDAAEVFRLGDNVMLRLKH
jgi:ferric-dicitrate binding protein FerR (iron transport regulator)